ncbi:sigma-70 family RNA polymerase sigma factor [Streptomyces sp. SID2131]|nr:sigma-70 family RNA polymerase sigma factor [Streptomyces sp. SID2131]
MAAPASAAAAPAESRSRVEEFEAEAVPYRAELLAAAVRLVRSHADAEDLLQETYLKAFRSFHQYRLGTNVRAWLYRIMTNTHFTHHRSARTRPRIVGPYDEDAHVRPAHQPASYRLASAEDQHLEGFVHPEIGRALRSLPREYAAVLRLADVEGRSYQEIAGLLGIATGTVGSRVHRGRRRMRELIPHLDPHLDPRPDPHLDFRPDPHLDPRPDPHPGLRPNPHPGPHRTSTARADSPHTDSTSPIRAKEPMT